MKSHIVDASHESFSIKDAHDFTRIRKGEGALKKIWTRIPLTNIHFEELELADLASIEAFAKQKDSRSKARCSHKYCCCDADSTATSNKGFYELKYGTN